MTLSLPEIQTTDFRTTSEAFETNEKFKGRIGMKTNYGPARLAIAKSLSDPTQPDLTVLGDDKGKPIKGEFLFGTGVDLATWVSLIVEHTRLSELTKKQLQQYVGAHWHRGIKALEDDWIGCEEDFDRFIVHVLERAGTRHFGGTPIGMKGEGEPPAEFQLGPVHLTFGNPSEDTRSGEKVSWTINAPGVSPHIGIMGTLGTGKTRLATHMAREMRQQSNCAVILFDMGKGDLAEDSELVQSLGATVVNCPSEPIPLHALNVPERTNDAITNAALRFRDSFSNASKNKPGGIQNDILRDAAIQTLSRNERVKIEDIRNAVVREYGDRNRKEDAVTATFNDICVYELFSPQLSPREFFSRSWVIDVHTAPESIQRLVVFLIFDAVDAYLKGMQDAQIDEHGNRELKLVLMVDEARRVLGYQHQSLIEVVRTSRSKGGAAMFISQSPDDFAQEKENFLENLGLAVSFRTNASDKSLKDVFGQKVDLAGLENGVCVTRLPNDPSPRRVKTWK